ncbi:hypothetical protein F5Y03DRAFT_402568 [Xylaria venustula]|nr:hypothetical protein F5Y03DRAFT_402568 [Xylaria venustula]
MPPPVDLGLDAIDLEPLANQGDTVAPSESPILQLPYELLLAIFRALLDPSSVDSLAKVHPAMAVVHRENRDSIRKAVRVNFATEVAREATGYGLLELAGIALCLDAVSCLLPHFHVPTIEICSRLLSSSWTVSDEDMLRMSQPLFFALSKNQLWTVTKTFGLLGLFSTTTNLDRWYKKEFCPALESLNSERADETLNITFKIPAQLTCLKVFMIAEIWRRVYFLLEADEFRKRFLSSLPLELSLRFKQFTRCFVKMCSSQKGTQTLIWLQDQFDWYYLRGMHYQMTKLLDESEIAAILDSDSEENEDPE